MTQETEQTTRVINDNFNQFTLQIIQLIESNKVQEIDSLIADYIQAGQDQAHNLLLSGVLFFLHGDYSSTVNTLLRARDELDENDYPLPNTIFSGALIQAQLNLPRRRRLATENGYRFFKKNLSALQNIDPTLAQEIQNSNWPEDYVLIDFWSGLHFFSIQNKTLLLITDDVKQQLQTHLRHRFPIAFGGIGTGQELGHCLDHQVNILLGMTRAHYLFEKDPGQIKALLHLRDWSSYFATRELIFFGGTKMTERFNQIFQTLKYAPPVVSVGDVDMVQDFIQQLCNDLKPADDTDYVKQYYTSDEFRHRQERIARGQIQPRILISTSRWTTFLKYCSADYDKAFTQLGCETHFDIEDNDVQFLLDAYNWRHLREFKPDAFFMISHARPTIPYLPRELPYISHIQDRCGPLLRASDVSDIISPQDMFICLTPSVQQFVLERKVPIEQTFIMPVPVDETMFYPLPPDHLQAEQFTTDTSFIKHGHAAAEDVFVHFLQESLLAFPDEKLRVDMLNIFQELYRMTCGNNDKRYYEQEMHEFVRSRLPATVDETLLEWFAHQVTVFYIVVQSAAWRSHFLEALDQAGIELRLYGNDWQKHSRLGHLSKGPIDREKQLNLVYNFSRINLNINQSATMHPRLAECGLARGFMMVSDHPQDRDWGPARPYFQEDKEVVFFNTRADLIDRCRYYLEHKNQRQEIAQNMYERALRERTCLAGAKTVLQEWRKLLTRQLNL
ncbi:MAG: glycosyltransferase [Sedimentisphaerales bacterium]|nr:glycosyltransferase [Sedimentisphaerales bacterium]